MNIPLIFNPFIFAAGRQKTGVTTGSKPAAMQSAGSETASDCGSIIKIIFIRSPLGPKKLCTLLVEDNPPQVPAAHSDRRQSIREQ